MKNPTATNYHPPANIRHTLDVALRDGLDLILTTTGDHHSVISRTICPQPDIQANEEPHRHKLPPASEYPPHTRRGVAGRPGLDINNYWRSSQCYIPHN